MDESQISLLETDLAAQRLIIERVFATLEQRTENLSPDNPEKLESVAYQLHNLYGVIEGSLKIIAAYFENNIADSTRWHSLLLQRMTQPVQGIRPVVLSIDSFDRLNALRGFRHFFRHAYGIPIDFAQLQSNVEKARQLKPILEADYDQFLIALQQFMAQDN